MGSCHLGIVGLGVMGSNLALNFSSKGFCTAVFNRSIKVTEEFTSKYQSSSIKGALNLADFVTLLARPRVIVLMVTAGKPVDSMIEQILPLLEKGDIIVDAGNSYFKDTMRRSENLAEKGILFAGVGISGGAEGALTGPSIMAGCSEEAWEVIGPMFNSIAAKSFDGSPSCDRVGPDGSGHYVKMVHNAIEYIDMQLISEVFHIMKSIGYSYTKMAELFESWNKGDLESYLIQITSIILRKKDRETGKSMLDVILDTAEQKGTGLWAAESSLELGVPAYSIAASVYSRFMSSRKEERIQASKKLPRRVSIKAFDEGKLHDALYAAKLCAYSQGFYLLSEASRFYGWEVDNANVAHIWQGGCIIRAKLLQRVKEAFSDKGLKNLLLDPFISRTIAGKEESWRYVVSKAINAGIPVPGMSSALSYYDSYFTSRLPANLIQAQRDYFGAHTYRRIDKEGSFHTDWEKD